MSAAGIEAGHAFVQVDAASARRAGGLFSWLLLVDIGRRNLVSDKVRSAVALVGVTFAALLMLLQSAIYFGFVRSASSVVDHSPGELWIVKAGTVNFETAGPFSDAAVAQVRGVPDVEWAENLIYSFGLLKLPTGAGQWAHVVGFDPRSGIGGPWEMAIGQASDVAKPGTYIIDESALGQFEGVTVGDKVENFDHRAEIIAMSRGSRTCTPNPVVYTSFRTAQEHIPMFGGKTNFIVAKVRPGADPQVVKERLRRLAQFDVLTREEFSAKTRRYWATKTGIGIGIGVTILLGFIVGLVILGQTMYSATMARLEEFAALKIMGAANLQICAIIWYQAVLVAVGGYSVAIVLGFLIKQVYTGQVVSMHFSPLMLAVMLVVTVVMCLLASLLSIVRVLQVSPAAIFRV